MVNALGITEIHIGGLVFEFCVAETVKDGLRYLPNVKFKVFGQFCPSLDDKLAKEFTDFIHNTERVELV
jgi:nicotinamidase-related amidase